mmetsp:Transcript_84609/g.218038  ORF Transcript_84609/g.218038 Transcript_84609/m.218038 type:complete len:366 (+) Transcript_84609:61-1158(+)
MASRALARAGPERPLIEPPAIEQSGGREHAEGRLLLCVGRLHNVAVNFVAGGPPGALQVAGPQELRRGLAERRHTAAPDGHAEERGGGRERAREERRARRRLPRHVQQRRQGLEVHHDLRREGGLAGRRQLAGDLRAEHLEERAGGRQRLHAVGQLDACAVLRVLAHQDLAVDEDERGHQVRQLRQTLVRRLDEGDEGRLPRVGGHARVQASGVHAVGLRAVADGVVVMVQLRARVGVAEVAEREGDGADHLGRVDRPRHVHGLQGAEGRRQEVAGHDGHDALPGRRHFAAVKNPGEDGELHAVARQVGAQQLRHHHGEVGLAVRAHRPVVDFQDDLVSRSCTLAGNGSRWAISSLVGEGRRCRR